MKRTVNEQAEHEFQVKNDRRVRNEDKAWDKLTRQWDAAERMIGELIRDGEQVFYVWPAGGRYREGYYIELVEFLIRNRYV